MAQLGVRPPIQVQMTPCVMACSFPLDPLPDTRIHPRQPIGFRRTSHSPQLLCYTSESSLRRLVTSDRCVLGDAMVAADPVSAKPRGVIAARAARWPLLGERRALVGYVCSVVALYLVTLSGALLATRVEARDVATFVALLACGAVCIEAAAGSACPPGVSRDLLSAWWLPAALLLPPVYALLLRRSCCRSCCSCGCGRRCSTAGCSARPRSGSGGRAASWSSTGCARRRATASRRGERHGTARGRLRRGVHRAQHRADRDRRAHGRPADPVARRCCGTGRAPPSTSSSCAWASLVTIACALNPWLLLVALPPVVLLQRSLLHAQLQAAARTDAQDRPAQRGRLAARGRHRDRPGPAHRRDARPHASSTSTTSSRSTTSTATSSATRCWPAWPPTLRSQLREYDVVGRFGGEEFVVLLPSADIDEARSVAERLRSASAAWPSRPTRR